MSLTFVEHHDYKGKFLTDIWQDPKTGQYSSVVSDLEPITFSSLLEIKLYLTGTMEEWENGKKT